MIPKIYFWLSVSCLYASMTLIYNERGKEAWCTLAFAWLFETMNRLSVIHRNERIKREEAFCRAKSQGIPL